MAFIHGSNSKVYVTTIDLSAYFNNAEFQTTADVSETTAFGKSAKTYKAGLREGTATLSGGSATIDLDTYSGMTAGTWEALNTNTWSMVSSSGNAVTWSLSGKTLTINGPDNAVCSWMVIGERKDPTIIASDISDSDGKLIVEYEDANYTVTIEEETD